jgi:hypothetical protein
LRLAGLGNRLAHPVLVGTFHVSPSP